MRTVYFCTSAFPSAPEGDLEFCNGMPGSHLAGWIREGLIKKGYACKEPLQEDYGWGFWISEQGCSIWVSVSPAIGDPADAPEEVEWYVSVKHDYPFFFLRQLFRARRGRAVADEIFSSVKERLDSHPDIETEEV